MAEIKITQEMIDYYRSKPGNSVLLDSAIINLIQKDIQIPISGITSPVLMLFNFCLTYSQLGRIFSALSFL